MARILIADGHNFTATVTLDGLPPLTFTYRPALSAAVYAHRHGRTTPKAEEEATVKLIVDHVSAWDVDGDDGAAPVTAETVKRLPEPYRVGIMEYLTSWRAGDAAGK